ncbi:MAG: uroporphyrinogen-III C-methyltransferase [Microscillaceae bacterium]|nr:uroporphyrinogen-III C-methyltransferase [Microscillaceae bacterium]
MSKHKAKLTLVGAGPGDPELITLKGIRTLKEADVVLYDALVSPELLDYAPVQAPKIFVGKRAGAHYLDQAEINRLIVEFAFTHGHVVRLKGGDPFVFGRGFEEIQYAEAFGLETAVVPGISSAIAVPALQKIPLTQRGVSESFWVVTGTTRHRTVSQDMTLAAQSTATVIILMGTQQLEEIVQTFLRFRRPDTGVAIIQNGSLDNEKTAIADLNTIIELSRLKSIHSPAVIVVGNVVKEHPEFQYQLSYVQQEILVFSQ